MEVNGLTGEGAVDLVEYIEETSDTGHNKLILKSTMYSAVCGYCYGNKINDH